MLLKAFTAAVLLTAAAGASTAAAEVGATSVVYVSKDPAFVVLEGGTMQSLKRNEIVCFFLDDRAKTLCMRVVASNRTKSALIVPRDRLRDFRRGGAAQRMTLVPASKALKAPSPPAPTAPATSPAPPVTAPAAPAADVAGTAPAPTAQGQEQTAEAQSMAEAPWQAVPPPLPSTPTTAEEQRIADALNAIETTGAAPAPSGNPESPATPAAPDAAAAKPAAASDAKAKAEKDRDKARDKRHRRSAVPAAAPTGILLVLRPVGGAPFTFSKLGFAALSSGAPFVDSLWRSEKSRVEPAGAFGGELNLPFIPRWSLRLRPGARLESFAAQIDEGAYSELQITSYTRTTTRTEAWGVWADAEWLAWSGRAGRSVASKYQVLLRSGLDLSLSDVQLESRRIDADVTTALATARSRMGVLSLRLSPAIAYEFHGVALELSLLRTEPLATTLERFDANVTRPDGVQAPADLEAELKARLGHRATASTALLLSFGLYPGTLWRAFL